MGAFWWLLLQHLQMSLQKGEKTKLVTSMFPKQEELKVCAYSHM